MKNGSSRSRSTRGFTLIELLVVCGIIVMVTAVTLVSNERFGGVMQLDNLAYELSLSIRQAQVYGISVARSTSNTYSAGYGVHFALTAPGNYIFFNDISGGASGYPGDGLYESGELVETETLPNNYSIAALCSSDDGTNETCNTASTATLDLIFKRPEPDAYISVGGTSCVTTATPCKFYARIILQSPRGDQISVYVYNNGQIAVKK